MLLYDSLVKGASEYPSRTAVIFQDRHYSYFELKAMVDTLAAALETIGIGPGDSVAVLLPNCLPFTLTYYASSRLGAMCVPVNPLLKPSELEYIWSDCQAKIVVTVDQLLPNVQETLSSLGKTSLPVISVTPDSQAPGDVYRLAALMSTAPAMPKTALPQDSVPAVCIYTSGTTGRPKGAVLSHQNLTTNCSQAAKMLHIGDGDNFLCVLPLFHSFAGTVCQNLSLFSGAAFTILEQFHPGRVIEAVEKFKITLFAGVPAMYQALLMFAGDKSADFSGVRLCVSGGAPMPVPLMSAFEERYKTIIIEGDGPTECGPVTCLNPIDGVRKPGSVGVALPDMEMKIFDENNEELPQGEIGEMVVRGGNVMMGYLNQPEATAEAMTRGWYHTGDLGKVDEDGYFYIVDRKKDMLLVGGFNVYPREIEEVLYAHPAVADAAVVGAPDKLRGEEVVAIIVLKPDQAISARDISNFCRERLANYKVPRRVIFRDAMPRGGTGKILKRLLRKEMEMEAEAISESVD